VGEARAVYRHNLVCHTLGEANGVFVEAGGKVRATTHNQDLRSFPDLTSNQLLGRILGPTLGEARGLGVAFEAPGHIGRPAPSDETALIASFISGKEPFDSLDHGAPLLSPPQGRRGSGEGSALPGHNLRLCFIVFVELIMVS
jgi:hypothetical protein